MQHNATTQYSMFISYDKMLDLVTRALRIKYIISYEQAEIIARDLLLGKNTTVMKDKTQ